MSKDYNNKILNDCAWFAEKHRGKNKRSGPHWSTIIRFTPLFDEAVRLQNQVRTLLKSKEDDTCVWTKQQQAPEDDEYLIHFEAWITGCDKSIFIGNANYCPGCGRKIKYIGKGE